jgi:hypothetical protein
MPSWSKKFRKPIVIRDGREIATLADAHDLLLLQPKRHQDRRHLQYAVELLIGAAERGTRASIDDAAAQLSRALTAEGLL